MIGAISLIAKLKERRRTPVIPSLNLLPEEYQGHRFLKKNARYLFFLAAEVLLIAFLFQSRGQATSEGLSLIRSRYLSSGEAVTTETALLQTQLSQLTRENQSITRARKDIATLRKPWPDVLTALVQASPQGLRIHSITQAKDVLAVAGTAESTEKALEFRRNLLDSPYIQEVPIRTLTRGVSGQVSFKMDVVLGNKESK